MELVNQTMCYYHNLLLKMPFTINSLLLPQIFVAFFLHFENPPFSFSKLFQNAACPILYRTCGTAHLLRNRLFYD